MPGTSGEMRHASILFHPFASRALHQNYLAGSGVDTPVPVSMNSTLYVPDFHLSKELFDPVFILEETLCMSDLGDHFVPIACTTGALHQNYMLASEKMVQGKGFEPSNSYENRP